MEKNQLLKIFKIQNAVLGLFLLVLALLAIVFTNDRSLEIMGYGILVGGLLGVGLNHFKQIPHVYGKKDERELVLMIISILMSVSLACICFVILYMISAFDLVALTQRDFTTSIMVVSILALGVRYLTFSAMNRLL